ncbi:MAG TPA: hypothetical protein VM901_12080 [Bdellovibrionota bacterium]|jgi:exopolyphosphatase/guanosine-5'-triphosphate,3'-diphosphate pyrophosphatase|nr:hypothetical protein [Bdellovibrionota bacterium]
MRAVVDIGSNSIKYTLERSRGDASSCLSDSRVIALGKGLKAGSPLSAEALARLDTALKSFAPALAPCAGELVVVGTAALRSCSNPEAARELVQRHLGAPLHIIPGEREAELSFLGASLDSPFQNPLCVDVGGASTEVGLTRGGKLTSVPWGALRVHENILRSEVPVTPAVWRNAQTQLDQIFAAEMHQLSGIDGKAIDGVLAIGGSLMMCAKSLYPEQRASKTVAVSRARLREFQDKVATTALSPRISEMGFSADRADIACAGLMCLFAAIHSHAALDRMVITEGGLRNGIFQRWSDFAV